MKSEPLPVNAELIAETTEPTEKVLQLKIVTPQERPLLKPDSPETIPLLITLRLKDTKKRESEIVFEGRVYDRKSLTEVIGKRVELVHQEAAKRGERPKTIACGRILSELEILLVADRGVSSGSLRSIFEVAQAVGIYKISVKSN